VGSEKSGLPTAQSVNCVTKDPGSAAGEVASLQLPMAGSHGMAGDVSAVALPIAPVYKKFTSQDEMGHFLVDHYKIRNPKDLASCEVCHR
jgi:hypothetical protein